MTFVTHDEPNGSHRRVHPDKKKGRTRKQKVSRPPDGIGHISSLKKSSSGLGARRLLAMEYGKLVRS